MTTRRHFLGIAGSALAAPALIRAAHAQAAWPTRRLSAMVPFAAGSTIDIVGRIVMEPLGAQLGQPIIIENRGGGGGTIGTAASARAEADGYNILLHAAAHSAAPAAYPNAPYDPARDFSGVAVFGTVPNVMIVAPSSGIKSAQELAEKGKSGNLTFASAGVGSATHWAAERFRLSAGFKATHVPFRGGQEPITEVMTGRIDFALMGVSATIEHIRDGKLSALAVSTPKRSSALPDVPTTLEAGFANSDYNYWMGMLVPAKTPREIVERLHRETMQALEHPNVVPKFKVQGIEPLPLSPAQFDAMIVKEIALNRELVAAAGLKFN